MGIHVPFSGRRDQSAREWGGWMEPQSRAKRRDGDLGCGHDLPQGPDGGDSTSFVHTPRRSGAREFSGASRLPERTESQRSHVERGQGPCQGFREPCLHVALCTDKGREQGEDGRRRDAADTTARGA